MPKSKTTQPFKINLQMSMDVIDKIKQKLRVIARFRKTCFGHFLDFALTNQASQLMLDLIQRQCKPNNPSELNFLIGGRVLKFGLREFALITGLNCGQIPEIDREKIKGGQHIRKFLFNGKRTISREYLNMGFRMSHCTLDDDMLKISLLYFLENFLLFRKDNVNVNMDHIIMVDDEKLFDTYPWGRLAFDLIVEYMHEALLSKGATGISVGGFIFPILVWACEVVPSLGNFFTRKMTQRVPRILNWIADTQPKWKDFECKVFESPKVPNNNVFDLGFKFINNNAY